MALYDLPSIEEELDRKTVETIQDFIHKYEAKQITLPELRAALTAVWSVSSGLAHDNNTDLIAATEVYLKDQKKGVDRKTVMVSKTQMTAVIRWDSEKASLVILQGHKIIKKTKKEFDTDDIDQSKKAYAFAEETVAKLKTMGFVEI